MVEHTPITMQTGKRKIADVVIVDIAGRITVGEGSATLRELVREAIGEGNRKILLNLHQVGYIDSSGLGELVKSYTTVRSQGGQLKLVQVSKRVHDLLQMTRLNLVLEIEPDEATAIQSFAASAMAQRSPEPRQVETTNETIPEYPWRCRKRLCCLSGQRPFSLQLRVGNIADRSHSDSRSFPHYYL